MLVRPRYATCVSLPGSLLTYFQAYDSHCNIVLGEVEETIYIVEEDENGEETVKVTPDS